MAFDAGAVIGRIKLDTSGFARGIRTVQAGMKRVSASARAASIRIGAMTAGLAAALVPTIKIGAEFESAVADMVRVTSRASDAIRSDILGMASELGRPTDLMKGFYQVISAGVKGAENQMDALRVASMGAQAAHLDQATVIKALTKLMAGYEGKIKNVTIASDLLFAIEKEGQTSFAELAPIIGTVAAKANTLGISFDSLGASFAVITRQAGTTREAATQLRALITALSKPTRELTALTERLEFADFQAMIASLGFSGALEKIREEAGGSAVKLNALLQSTEAVDAFNAIAQRNFKALADAMVSMADKAGGTAKTFDEWRRTLEGQWFRLRANMDKLRIGFSASIEEPVKRIVIAVNNVAEATTTWMKDNQDVVKQIAQIALGITLAGVAFTGLTVAIWASFAALTAWLSPIGLALTGALAFAAVAFTIRAAWNESLRAILGDTAEMEKKQGSILSTAWNHWRQFLGLIDTEWFEVIDALGQVVSGFVNGTIGLFVFMAKAVIVVFKGLFNSLLKVFERLHNI